MEPSAARIGFYGKVPCRGDFVGEGLAPDFLDHWDPWLAAAIAESKTALGPAWLDAYLVAPVWRFALSAGACGTSACAGVLMASVDQVGRYFPLTLARPVGRDASLLALAASATAWFEEAEAIALASLEDGFDFHAWGGRLLALADMELPAQSGRAVESVGDGLRLSLAAGGDLRASLLQALEEDWRQRLAPLCLWWTDARAERGGTLLAFRGLPPPAEFRLLLDPASTRNPGS